MVRLVFRPYTQVRRSICTLEPLRTSTRVSPGFVLLRHSSPSFGSQHVCSHSNLSLGRSWSVDSAGVTLPISSQRLYFHFALGSRSLTLAHMLDSLVRVSRRVDEIHFASVLRRHDRPKPSPMCSKEARPAKALKGPNAPLPPIGSFSAISGTISLSFQSSFHLSLTVLVCYRSPTHI